MSTVWLRRLRSDYEKICTAFTGKSRIRLLKTAGDPPEKYQFELLVTGLQKDAVSQEIRSHNDFIAEVTLTRSYPRMAPQCKMLTPVFHPNIAPHAICIGDHWAAGESLPHLIIRIAEMISFQSYNVKSPLNGEAAQWVEQNADQVPLDLFDFSSLLDLGQAVGRKDDGSLKAGSVCANCGKHGEGGSMQVCINGHVACESCVIECSRCHAVMCLKCDLHRCASCKASVCHQCIYRCLACNRAVCMDHVGECAVCGQWRCHDCLTPCDACGKVVCMGDIHKAAQDGKSVYLCTACTNASAPQQA